MDIWMSLFISLLLFVVACLLNVVRIAILKRNAYIQEQRERKEKLVVQIRAITQLLRGVLEKVQGGASKTSRHKTRARNALLIRPRTTAKLPWRKKRAASFSKFGKQFCTRLLPLPSATGKYSAGRGFSSSLASENGFETISDSAESSRRSSVSSELYDELDENDSFSVESDFSSLSIGSDSINRNAEVDTKDACANSDDISLEDGETDGKQLSKRLFTDLCRVEAEVEDDSNKNNEFSHSTFAKRNFSAKLLSKISSARAMCGDSCSEEKITKVEKESANVQTTAVRFFDNQVKETDNIADATLLQLAQVLRKQEMKAGEKLFWIPEETRNFSNGRICSYRNLQRRRSFLSRTMKSYANENRKDSKKATLHKKQQLQSNLSSEKNYCNKFDETRKKIIAIIKSAMEMHWKQAALEKENQRFSRPPGEVLCYECANGLHLLKQKQDAVKSYNNQKIKRSLLLSKRDGFEESCPVVALVNQWCDKLLGNCRTNRSKATKLDELLRRVLIEFYSQRYLQCGQLVSQALQNASF